MKCPYNNFEECYTNECAAWRKTRDPIDRDYYLHVCAIAFNGGVPQGTKRENTDGPNCGTEMEDD